MVLFICKASHVFQVLIKCLKGFYGFWSLCIICCHIRLILLYTVTFKHCLQLFLCFPAIVLVYQSLVCTVRGPAVTYQTIPVMVKVTWCHSVIAKMHFFGKSMVSLYFILSLSTRSLSTWPVITSSLMSVTLTQKRSSLTQIFTKSPILIESKSSLFGASNVFE